MTPRPRTPIPAPDHSRTATLGGPYTRVPWIVWVVLGLLVALGLAIVLDGFGRLKLGHEGARGSFALGFFLMALGIGVIVLAYWLTHARRDWAAGEQGAVAARPRVHLGLPWGVALLCLAFVGFLLPSGWQELRPERLLQGLRALALLALAAPFVWAVIQTARRWRSAEVVFVPDQRATMGGRLCGTLHTRLRHRPRGSVTLTLSCLHRSITGERQVHETEETLWQGHHEVTVEHFRPGPDGLAIPVSIPLPKSRELSLPGWGTVEWRLAVRGKLAGPDLDAAFPIEVSTG